MAFKLYNQIINEELPSMEVEGVNAFLKDFSVSKDADKPITSGLFRLKAGESLKYTYTYHEMKFIVDGRLLEPEVEERVQILRKLSQKTVKIGPNLSCFGKVRIRLNNGSIYVLRALQVRKHFRIGIFKSGHEEN